MIDQTKNKQQEYLINEHNRMQQLDMRQEFRDDSGRAEKFSLQACGLYLDYSKNLIDDHSLEALAEFAKSQDVMGKFAQQIKGEIVNPTENQAATHTQERSGTESAKNAKAPLYELSSRIIQEIEASKPTSLGKIKRVINFGIGGSHLGGTMVCAALPPQKNAPKVEFVSSLSPNALYEVIDIRNRRAIEETMFIVSSKSFGTEETLVNAKRVLDAYGSLGGDAPQLVSSNFYAITAKTNKAMINDIPFSPENVFTMNSTIGGRYSLWSAIALPIILHCGEDAFEELMDGARAMDEHCANSHPTQNMPLILALLSYWYLNYFNSSSTCINVYEHNLSEFPNFLQQLVMESCGKSAMLSAAQNKQKDEQPDEPKGESQDVRSEIIWGGVGTAIQHSYMQLCHQGNQLIPIDFILGAKPPSFINYNAYEEEMHKIQISHCLAQSQALLLGRKLQDAKKEAQKQGVASEYAHHLIMSGNRPSNTLIYESLSPQVLGSLIALYEHRTVLFAYLSDINPFDQWGVELGKQLSSKIKDRIIKHSSKSGEDADLDSSTKKLIEHINSCQ